jgi:hypothetical protein
MAKKWVYAFNEVTEAEQAVGGKWDDVRALLGGKGTSLGILPPWSYAVHTTSPSPETCEYIVNCH